MQLSRQRRMLFVAILATVAASAVALATPWAEPFRRAIRPHLPLFVVVLAVFSLVAQLIAGLVQVLSQRGSWRSIAVPLSLGSSALCTALAFVPGGGESAPRLFPILGAALFAVIAAALQRRARERPGL